MAPLRRSTRTKKSPVEAVAMSTSSSSNVEEKKEEEEGTKKNAAPKRRRAVRPKKKKDEDSSGADMSDSNSSSSGDEKENEKETRVKKSSPATATKKKKNTKSDESDSDKEEQEEAPPKKKKKTKAADHQRITDRDELPKLWNGEEAMETHGSYTFKIISWNVAGLRALMRNHPTALSDLATKHKPDVICLQETKLQEIHVNDAKLQINGVLLVKEGYDAYYNCATAKKGYSGTAVFVKRRKGPKNKKEEEDGGGGNEKNTKGEKKQATIGSFFQSKKKKKKKEEKEEDNNEANKNDESTIDTTPIGDIDISNLIPLNVSYKLGKSEHDNEGRIITVDFPSFSMSNLYVPNSGQKLDRLGYRTDSWDADLLSAMQRKEKQRKVPVIWLGDLNVAHTAKDVWNDGAKHLAKSAGTTPEERASFQKQLDAGYVDIFRQLHPEAQGQYSYWSQRAGNRPPNKGLRLDYFVGSSSLIDDEGKVVARDSYILYDQVGSDHCPIVLEMEMKK